MATRYVTISVTPGTAVATDGTIDFPYPSGYAAAARFSQDNEVLVIRGLQNTLAQAADTFTVAYDGDSATVTYKDATTIPAGTEVLLMIELADYTAVTTLTDSTGGTASTTAVANLADGSTYATDHAAIENNFATLTAKLNTVIARVNTLLTLSRSVDNVP